LSLITTVITAKRIENFHSPTSQLQLGISSEHNDLNADPVAYRKSLPLRTISDAFNDVIYSLPDQSIIAVALSVAQGLPDRIQQLTTTFE